MFFWVRLIVSIILTAVVVLLFWHTSPLLKPLGGFVVFLDLFAIAAWALMMYMIWSPGPIPGGGSTARRKS